MSIINKTFLQLSKKLLFEIDQSKKDPFKYQNECFNFLLKNGRETLFGKEHNFNTIINFTSGRYFNGNSLASSIGAFQKNIPIRDYNAFVPYINSIREGKDYVLWNQKVKWFAKSSGTSSDKSKFIPISPCSLTLNHYGGFRRMLASYINSFPNSKLFNGKALTLGGSVQLDLSGSKFAGDLSAILLKNSPCIAELFRTPSRKTALTADFSYKIEKICKESIRENVSNFAGVPSWNLILMNKILEYSGKENIAQVWKNIELFMHGGIGFEPYREIYKKLFPISNMHYLENYNASEGYFGFQDDLSINSMMFTVGNGVFYEFIPSKDLDRALEGEIYNFPTINQVELGVNYALVISTVGGLWRYLIGDTIKFTSLYPHRFIITGRTQLFINAFGEELMINNTEQALAKACLACNCNVSDYTVAPVFMDLNNCKGHHKWLIEFSTPPRDIKEFTKVLDNLLCDVNSDYQAKRADNATMEELEIISVAPNTFYKWLQKRGKIGGQNKVPRLWKDQTYINELSSINNN